MKCYSSPVASTNRSAHGWRTTPVGGAARGRLTNRVSCDSSAKENSAANLGSMLVAQAGRRLKRIQQAIVSPHKVHNSTLKGLHKPATVVLLPAYLLGAVSTCAGVPGPHWVPVFTGAMIGSFFACLDRWCKVRLWKEPRKPLNVVVTGGSKGLGKALAREFLQDGDSVVVSARCQKGIDKAVQQLQSELGPDICVYGVACDVSDPDSVRQLEQAAVNHMGHIDVWINNAGYSGSFQAFLQTSPEAMEQVVRTNLLGTMLCSRQAISAFKRQSSGGHLFNMDGAGADGSPTAMYAAYGATKAGITQLCKSLQLELGDSPAKVHTLSPGMMLTDLLLEGATVQNKQVFNILCEHPETVAAFLVPRMKTVVARDENSSYIKFLTPASALYRFLTAPVRLGRFFDAQGKPVYLPESERIYGRQAKATARRIERARQRTGALALAYSLSLIISVMVLLETANGIHLV